MREYVLKRGLRWRTALVALAMALSFVCLPGSAYAVIKEYHVYGDITNAPIHSGPVDLSHIFDTRFNMNIDKGDLVLAYNDNDTASTADDLATLTGTTTGCITGGHGGCGASMNGRATQPFGIHYGSGTFEWDVTMSNAIAGLTTGPQQFAFDMEMNAGTITLQNTTGAYKNQLSRPGDPSADLTIKRDKNFAFAVNPTANGGYDGEGWLQLTGGFLGLGGVRFEFGANNNVLNWAFRLDPINITPGPDPDPNPGPEPVPEPATLLLLGAGLLGAKRRSIRRSKIS